MWLWRSFPLSVENMTFITARKALILFQSDKAVLVYVYATMSPTLSDVKIPGLIQLYIGAKRGGYGCHYTYSVDDCYPGEFCAYKVVSESSDPSSKLSEIPTLTSTLEPTQNYTSEHYSSKH